MICFRSSCTFFKKHEMFTEAVAHLLQHKEVSAAHFFFQKQSHIHGWVLTAPSHISRVLYLLGKYNSIHGWALTAPSHIFSILRWSGTNGRSRGSTPTSSSCISRVLYLSGTNCRYHEYSKIPWSHLFLVIYQKTFLNNVLTKLAMLSNNPLIYLQQ